MKKSTLAVSLCLSVISSGARAWDWSLNSTLTETVEANDNPFLRAVAGGALSSYSTILANAVARTPDTKFAFDGSASYQKYWGPGVEGLPSENQNYSAHFLYQINGKGEGDREYVETSWNRSNSAFALLGQLGVLTNATGYLDTSRVGGGIDRWFTARDFISVSAHETYTSYDPGTAGTALVDTSANATWRHRVSSIATVSISSDAEFEHFDNSLGTDTLILRESAGIDANLSPLVTFSGTAGAAYIQVENGSPAFSLLPVSTPSASASSSLTDFIGNAVLTYKMFSDTTFTLNAFQTIAPSAVGTLIKSTSGGAGLSYQVNSHQSLSLATDLSRTTSSGITSNFWSGSASYNYVLTKEWNAQLVYRHLHQFAMSGTTSTGFVVDPVTGIAIPLVAGTGPVDSNSIKVVITRSLSILPDGY